MVVLVYILERGYTIDLVQNIAPLSHTPLLLISLLILLRILSVWWSFPTSFKMYYLNQDTLPWSLSVVLKFRLSIADCYYFLKTSLSDFTWDYHNKLIIYHRIRDKSLFTTDSPVRYLWKFIYQLIHK